MLKTNSKKAVQNIRNYIMDKFNFEDYKETGLKEPTTWEEISAFIWDRFVKEKRKELYSVVKKGQELYKSGLQNVFIDWCQGLPSVLDACYYYNRSAIDDLGAILEETPEEKERFTQSAAEEMLSKMIFEELLKNRW